MRNVAIPAPLYLRSSWRSTNHIIIIIIIIIINQISFSGECPEDFAASMSSGHVDLSKAHCLGVARPKLSGRRSSSTVLNQVCLASPVFGRTLNAGLKSSRMVLTGVATTEVREQGKTAAVDR